jgi:uncharacterized membrane protein
VAGVLASLLFLISSSLPVTNPLSFESLALAGVLAPLWLTGVYRWQRGVIGGLGRTGYVAGLLGVSLVVIRLLTMVMVTSLGAYQLQGLFISPVGMFFKGISFVMFVWGMIALGTASLTAGIFPRGTTVLWMVGLMQAALRPSLVSGALAGAGIAWSSYILWASARQKQQEPEAAQQVDPGGEAVTFNLGDRILALDALRGLIMILMAIDHASLFIRRSHPFELWNMPITHYESAAAFLTRFVTHPCAPGFYFLMGAGIIQFAQSRRLLGWSHARVVAQLVLRGLFFILLEQLILDPMMRGNVNFKDLEILYGLGGVMVLCAMLVRVNKTALLATGLGIVLVTQLLPSRLQELGIAFTPLVRLLLVPGTSGDWFVLYSPFPWLGVAVLGMAFGHELLRDQKRAFRLALWAGVICLLLFPVVRFAGGFGNLQPAAGTGWIDFLNVVKYPPSLVFTLLTLGINCVLLSLFARTSSILEKWCKPVLVFGKTALYFFLTHWFLYGAFGFFFFQPGTLLPMYTAWGVGLLLLYPLCREYMSLKRRTSPDSVWRLV